MTNMDKLYEAVEARGPVCVGLDTDFSYLPADFVDSTLTKGENIVRFNKKLIDATKAVAGCYKVQIAYYESLGMEGMKAYADTLKAVREAGVPVIADIKRGDIAKTAEMYAKAHFTVSKRQNNRRLSHGNNACKAIRHATFYPPVFFRGIHRNRVSRTFHTALFGFRGGNRIFSYVIHQPHRRSPFQAQPLCFHRFSQVNI